MTAAVPDWISRQLQELLAQRGHAWLLQGPSGLGQYELALGLAAAWLCENASPLGACGECPSCHAIQVRTHPDLCVLMPETLMIQLGWPLDEKAQADIDDKKRKASQEIRVDAMRDAIEFAQRTDARGRGKAVLVHPADRMNHVTANALLKTLEEPPGAVRFVLATDAAHQLLPTIRSRCISHAMAWPDKDLAQAWLVGQGVDAETAAVALQACGQRPYDALDRVSAGFNPGVWSRLPKAAASGDVSAFSDMSAPQLVTALQQICHDVMLHACGSPPRYFAVEALPSARPNPATLGTWWKELHRAARHQDHPFKPELMAEALVSRASRALNSKA